MLTKLIIVLSCLALLGPVTLAAGLQPAPAGATLAAPDGAGAAGAEPIGPGDQVITTSWTDEDGMNHTLSTERKTGESVENWGARHAEAVGAFTALFPPA